MHGRGYQTSFGPPATPVIIKQLLIANLGFFIAQLAFRDMDFTELLAIQPARVWQGGYLWQPLTYMWLHGGLGHLAMNCFVLWMFGSQLAMAWGAKRFFRYYLLCGVGAGVVISVWPYALVALGMASPRTLLFSTLGASGAIYGVLLAYSFTWPDRTIMLIFPPVAFRAIWLIPIVFGMTYLMDPRGNISHIGHLGGVLVGWIYLRRRGETGGIFTWKQLQHRWRRYRMRRKLRAVQYDEMEARRRERKDRHSDRTLH